MASCSAAIPVQPWLRPTVEGSPGDMLGSLTGCPPCPTRPFAAGTSTRWPTPPRAWSIRQRGAAAPPRRGRHHASTRSPHSAFHRPERDRNLPAHRRACRARGAGARRSAAASTGSRPSPNCGAGKTDSRVSAHRRGHAALLAACRPVPRMDRMTPRPPRRRRTPGPTPRRTAASALPPGTRSGLTSIAFRAGPPNRSARPTPALAGAPISPTRRARLPNRQRRPAAVRSWSSACARRTCPPSSR